jgi:hypothetical protein
MHPSWDVLGPPIAARTGGLTMASATGIEVPGVTARIVV